MTVTQYRKRYKNCRYCKHCNFSDTFPFSYPCKAKRKDFVINRAKNCPLYEVTAY